MGLTKLGFRFWVLTGLTLLTVLLLGRPSVAQQTIKVQVNRTLDVQQVIGNVQATNSGRSRPAQTGDRLGQVGDGLTTSARSGAILGLDTGIGTIDVGASTQVTIQELSIQPDQSRVSRLQVAYGRVKLRLRKFSNPNSRLEIQTPAGISGVRGTEFGVAVSPNGKTAVAVLDGAVNTNAQNVDVIVPKGFQNFTIPGEPPSQPVPLTDDPNLTYSFERRLEQGQRRLRLVAQTDPVNQVWVNQQLYNPDRSGKFTVDVKLRSFPRVQVMVVTPLGQQKQYDLAF
jgi:FecR protein